MTEGVHQMIMQRPISTMQFDPGRMIKRRRVEEMTVRSLEQSSFG